VGEWLQEADVGIIAYKVNATTNTTISNKVFHYMGVGLAVLSTDMAPTRRVVQEVGCGRLIPEGSSTEQIAEIILEMKRSPSELAAMAQRGRKAVLEKYNWEVDFRRGFEDISSLVNGKQQGRTQE
jgi:glycosyltransferase involved in cell wall biosynthesis